MSTAAAHPRVRALIVTLVICGTVTSLVQSVVAPILPALRVSTGASLTDLSWMLTATLISGGVFAPILTRLGDQYGAKRMLFVALALMIVGSLVCALVNALPVLVAARALQGAGMAVVPLGMAVLRRLLPFESAMRSGGVLSASMGVGSALGVPFAGLIVELTDWHVMFWVMCALAAVGLVLTAVTVPSDGAGVPARFDLAGGALLAAVIVGLLLGVTKASEWGLLALAVVAGALVLGVVLAVVERRTRSPLVDVALNLQRPVLFMNLSAVLVGFGFYSNSLVSALLVQEPTMTGYGLGLDIAATGIVLLPGGVGIMLLSPVSARISARFGPRVSLVLGSAIIAVGYLTRILAPVQFGWVIAGASIISIGVGFAYAAYPAMIQTIAPARETASVNGMNTLARLVGSATCGALITVLLATFTFRAGGVTYPTLGAYHLVFAIAGASALLSLAAALLAHGSAARRVRQTGTGGAAPTSTTRSALPLPQPMASQEGSTS